MSTRGPDARPSTLPSHALSDFAETFLITTTGVVAAAALLGLARLLSVGAIVSALTVGAGLAVAWLCLGDGRTCAPNGPDPSSETGVDPAEPQRHQRESVVSEHAPAGRVCGLAAIAPEPPRVEPPPAPTPVAAPEVSVLPEAAGRPVVAECGRAYPFVTADGELACPLPEAVREFEKYFILRALDRTDNNYTQAARLLGLNTERYTGLQRLRGKMIALGIMPTRPSSRATPRRQSA